MKVQDPIAAKKSSSATGMKKTAQRCEARALELASRCKHLNTRWKASGRAPLLDEAGESARDKLNYVHAIDDRNTLSAALFRVFASLNTCPLLS